MRICAERQPPELIQGASRVSCWLQHGKAERRREAHGLAALPHGFVTEEPTRSEGGAP
jgi:hypothetical protein